MHFATVRHEGRTYAARLEDNEFLLLGAADLGALVAAPGGLDAARELKPLSRVAAGDAVPQILIPQPPKMLCIGLNYVRHIEEVGAQRPEHPTVFAKFANSLIGPTDDIELPTISEMVDWEAELVIVIGRTVRDADPDDAAVAIAGFTVGNDISARDLQSRTTQWLQGKTCDRTTPVGPVLVTTDELGVDPDLAVRCAIDDVVRQDARTSDLLFKPVDLVAYLSQIMTLEAGDLIFTGTPNGVGQGLNPPAFLEGGQTVTTTIEGIGSLVNRCRAA